MTAEIKRYRAHPVFSELGRYTDFYESLATSIFDFASTGTTALVNFNTYFFSSVQGTIWSIRTVLRAGRINDAYALLRKYHDSAIINIYCNLYLADELNKGNVVVRKIDDWLKGVEPLPEYRVMSSYIRSAKTVSEISRLLYADDRYKKIRDRCNDHVHYNFFANALLNDSEVRTKGRLMILDTFSSDVKDLFILHMVYLFSINGHYMASSDYVDALDCGLVPKLDSQYWVAPFIQAVFNDIITARRPEITAIIKEQSDMQLE